MPGDDDLLALLHQIEQLAELVLRLEGANPAHRNLPFSGFSSPSKAKSPVR
jgi:hypothetical protein